MTDKARGSESERRDSRPASSAEEAALSARLRGLGDQLGRHRPGEQPELRRSQPAADAAGYARGFRLSSELVGGVLVGAGIGWALDRLLGISPWGLIVFLLLGFAAGVVNVVRAVAPRNDPGHPPDS